MAELICTIEEYHKFIGPRIRNAIQTLTKKRKKELDHICQMCKKSNELEAAHLIGNDRKLIIEKVLKKAGTSVKNGFKLDLQRVEEEIISAHKPIGEHFKFLCSNCHSKYDSK